jgi:hypothetical protein
MRGSIGHEIGPLFEDGVVICGLQLFVVRIYCKSPAY